MPAATRTLQPGTARHKHVEVEVGGDLLCELVAVAYFPGSQATGSYEVVNASSVRVGIRLAGRVKTAQLVARGRPCPSVDEIVLHKSDTVA